ncbi:hypothetical protein, conserved [Eimeria acervulina]|uniref:Acylphosphatase-like domain-containing protein n=1 Tax=Eimeria acervulina TaxID=5801 RepID=U6GRX8_EIMAC|nr:hypothetical protein, conserved [Eimeria acervulina]CDI82940.1 hypothetical protein, conserved [Eimeria acervulina]
MRSLYSIGESINPPDPRRRPPPSLLDPPPAVAPLKKGIPQLNPQFDTLNTIADAEAAEAAAAADAAAEADAEAAKAAAEAAAAEADEAAADAAAALLFAAVSTMGASASASAAASAAAAAAVHLCAADNGDVFRDKMLRVSRDLFLVGWIKCRSKFAIGHVQGDVYALSYFRRWMERHAEEEIKCCSFTEETIGLQKLDYEQMAAVNDYRSPAKKKLHMLLSAERQKAHQLERDAQRRAANYRDYLDAHCLQDY